MSRFDSLGRLTLPVLAGVLGAAVYIFSPLSHQAFCAPLHIPVIVAPDGPPSVPGDN